MAKAKEEALERQSFGALERPSFLKEGDTRGTENIGTNDIKPPALRLAQAMSPEVKRSEKDKFIPGLTEGMFFNSISRDIYGEGPLSVVIVNQLGHRNIEFDPVDKNTVLDFDVPDDDPRCDFTSEVRDGKQARVKPKATRFYDYLVLVEFDGRRSLMTVSLKGTQLKKAQILNTQLKQAKMPSFALKFDVTPVPEKRGSFSFYGWRIDLAGYVSEEVYEEASKLYDSMSGKKVEVDRAGEVDETGKSDDDIPF